MDSSEFALSTHAHPELTPGVYPIGAPAFTPSFHGPLSLSGKGGYFEVTDISIKALAPISIPFQCTIVGMEAKIKKRDTNEDIVVELNDGTENELDELIPITTLDTSGWAATDQSTIINSEAISYSYDPVTLVSPLFIRVIFNDVSPNLRFYWVKIYYTIP
jgi:hypothetical protein